MIRKLLLGLVLFGLAGPSTFATHYMGGEITWECLPNGNFRFILKVYRECGGIAYPTAGLSLNSNSPAGNLQMRLWPNQIDAIRDISPTCCNSPGFPNIQCLNTNPPQPSNQGAVEEWLYTTDVMYPNGVMLNGVPPANGWVFSYSSCCRNNATNYSSQPSWYLRAIMYNYNNQNYYPCWDDSPAFAEPPQSVVCAGYPYTFNHRAYDKQGDSLVFGWAEPLTTSVYTPIVTWTPGFSYQSPLPGPFHDTANHAAVIDPSTGDISMLSYTIGAFITVTRVSAYKCGVKIAEVFREIQMVIAPCLANEGPELVVLGGNPTGPRLYTDTVFVGQSLLTTINVIDTVPWSHPNGQPITVHVQASGLQFGTNTQSTTTGCLFPPCATLNPPAPITGTNATSFTINWQVSMDHFVGDTQHCSLFNPVYDFWFDVKDDICPIPALNSYTYRVVVDYPELGHTDWHCLNVDSSGDVNLQWAKVMDPMGIFSFYELLYAPSPQGPFISLDTLWSYNQTSYIHQGTQALSTPYWYFLKAYYTYKSKIIPRKVFLEPTAHVAGPADVCVEDTFMISFEGAFHPGDSISWHFGGLNMISGAGNGPYSLSQNIPGTYTVSMARYDSCGVSWFEKDIIVHPLPQISITGNPFYCPGKPVNLEAHGASTYLWSTGDKTAAVSISGVQWPTTYHLTATDMFGCKNTVSIFIRGIQTYDFSELCLVSVDQNTQQMRVVWEKTPNEDIKAFRILMHQQGQWFVRETLAFHMSGVYMDSLYDPTDGQHHYALQVIDSCDRFSDTSALLGSMHLVAAPFGTNVGLSWLPYTSPMSSLYVHVYRYDEVSGVFQHLDSVSTNTINYVDVNPPFGPLAYLVVIHGLNCQVDGQLYADVYSNVVSYWHFTGIEEPDASPGLSLLPDYINQSLRLEWGNAVGFQAELILFDGLGRQVMHTQLDAAVPVVNIQPGKLKEGVYFWLIRGEGQRIHAGKIYWR